MTARILLKQRFTLAPDVFAELRVFEVEPPVRRSTHSYKYGLALVVDGICVVRYDNEAGKGDHRHIGKHEEPYRFVSLEKLLDSFWKEVDRWLSEIQ